ncbi:DUF4157 domain-containing protein [Pontibacter qinzhouensis]|uniref:DUF4157 domain-containing protein n=2 Tax=Pontibacter qinzhouensis TaxID=2603253 RepID=A0A5C8KE70_9BACT|nr:DUF4157 domain-containing protein [Pontibacter qinzhouensis]
MAHQVMTMPEPAQTTAAAPPEEEIQRQEEELQRTEEEVQPKLQLNVQRQAEEEEVQRQVEEEQEVQRKCSACASQEGKVQREAEKEEIQTKSFATASTGSTSRFALQRQAVAHHVHIHCKFNYGLPGVLVQRSGRGPPQEENHSFEHQLESSRGTGSPLPSETRGFMESRFQADFSGVRIYSGETSAKMNQQIQAQAFTYGNDIFFNNGKYAPASQEGQHLLAHELTHTIQQGASHHSVSPATAAGGSSAIAPKHLSRKKIQRSPAHLAAAVSLAKGEAGKVIANKTGDDGYRVGWPRLSEYFKTTLGPEKITADGQPADGTTVPESSIKKKREVEGVAVIMPDGKAGVGKRDAMPSWCGIFAFWALNKAGLPMKKWLLGRMTIPREAALAPGVAPMPGAIAYRDMRSHYGLVESSDGSSVTTINGNTAGSDNLGGEIQVQTHALSNWTAFIDPMKLVEGALRNPELGVQEKPKSLRELQKDLFNVQRKEDEQQSTAEPQSKPAGEVKPFTLAPRVLAKAEVERPEEQHRQEEKPEEERELQRKQFTNETAVLPLPLVHRQSAPKVQRGIFGRIKGAISSAAEWVGDRLEEGKRWVLKKVRNLIMNVPGYKALRVALGYDPISGEDVPFTGKNFIEAAVELMPFGNKLLQKLRELGILEKAEQFVDSTIGRVKSLISNIGDTFSRFFNSLSLSDVRNVGGVFNRLEEAFTSFFNHIINFAKGVARDFLEFIKQALLIPLAHYIKNKTRFWDLLCLIMGKDPLTDEARPLSGANILNAFLNLSEWGVEQRKKMQETGTFNKVAAWIDKGISIFGKSYSELKAAFAGLWNYVNIESLMDPRGTFQKIFDSFWRPIKRVGEYVVETGIMILKIVKDVLFQWISREAKKRKGYYLITVLISRDPFTGEKVPRTTENLIKGFMLLSENGEEQFNKMKESGAIDRATQKIDAAVKTLGFSWEYVKGLFTSLWESFTWKDLLVPVLAFGKIIKTFANPIARLVRFAITVIMALIEVILRMMGFPVDLVFKLIDNVKKAWSAIKANVSGFFMNLLRAIKQGFSQFFNNVLVHLVEGLKVWFLSEVEAAGIPIPTDFTVVGLLKWLLVVLDITMEKIWKKLEERIGKEKVDKIKNLIAKAEKIIGMAGEAYEFVQDVRKRGFLAVIGDKIKEKLNNVWDMVLGAVKSFVMDQIIKKVTQKLLSMLDPTGIMAVVNSAIALYKAIQSFIRYLKQMLEIVNSFVEGTLEIAQGSIQKAGDFLENALARGVPVVIGFLANQVGLNLSERLRDALELVREKVDVGLTWVIDKLVGMVESLVAKVQEVKEKIMSFLGFKKVFKAGKANHTIFFEGSEDNPSLMVASEKKDFLTAVADRRAELDKHKESLSEEQKKERTKFKTKLTNAVTKHAEIKTKESELKAEKDESRKSEIQREIFKLVDSIIAILEEVGVTEHDVEKVVLTPPIQVGDFIKQGKKAYQVEDLTPGANGDFTYDFKAKHENGGIYYGKFLGYGSAYTKIPAEALPVAPEELEELNKESDTKFREKWDSYPDANKVLNYRRSGHQFNNDPAYQWEHTVEQSSGFGSHQLNSLANLSWTPTAINQEANKLYTTTVKSKLEFLPYEIKDKLYKDIAGVPGNISIREYLKNVSSFSEHKKIKEAFYSYKGLSRGQHNINNRGPFFVLS